jgi:homospermidine synthase
MASHVNRIVIVGFGNIGQAVLPLLARQFPGAQVHIFETFEDEARRAISDAYRARFVAQRVTRENYRGLLEPLLGEGDFLLNLATTVSTCDLIVLAQSRGALYLDTCIDPWEYVQGQTGIQTSNYALREQVLALRRDSAGASTAIVAHGANPGFVSILLKVGLVEMARARHWEGAVPASASEWAKLARQLDVRVVQVSERDTQWGSVARAEGEFVCTWSVDGLVTECLQPAELGWGTHERELPPGGRTHETGSGAGIWIDRPSVTVKVRSWSPNALDFEAYLITHNEALSIADYLTLREDGRVLYRPTAYYAYHPCDDAVASMALIADGTDRGIASKRILKDEIRSGIDELGVFIVCASGASLWVGSNLSIGKARRQAPHNNATSLQVVSSAVAAMAWMVENPRRGILESEEIDPEFVFRLTEPYWSPIVRQFIRWRPVPGASELQFADFLV